MSDPAIDRLHLDIEEQIERIRRARNESDKFQAEQRKLIAEAAKFEREGGIAPWLAGGAIAGGILTLVSLILQALGFIHR